MIRKSSTNSMNGPRGYATAGAVAGKQTAICGESGYVRVRGTIASSENSATREIHHVRNSSFVNTPWSKISSDIVENTQSMQYQPPRYRSQQSTKREQKSSSVLSCFLCIGKSAVDKKRSRPASSRSSADYTSSISRSRMSNEETSAVGGSNDCRTANIMKRIGSLEDLMNARDSRGASITGRSSLDKGRNVTERSRSETGFLDRAFENQSGIAFDDDDDE